MQEVKLEYLKVLYEAQQPIDFIYFPFSGVISMAKTLENGSSAEVGTIGNEGLAGLPALYGDFAGATGVHVEVPGEGLRIPVRIFREHLARSPGLQKLMNRFSYAMFNHVLQLAACNQFHDIEQRSARWLLMVQDRTGDTFPLTHEVLSLMLGVRRSSVTVAAGRLSDAGLIEYRRGEMTILNRPGLEKRSCECYRAITQEFDWALQGGR
jgi:CRP-like cAMP-binding protein